jgi:hypothetical protein
MKLDWLMDSPTGNSVGREAVCLFQITFQAVGLVETSLYFDSSREIRDHCRHS